MTSQDLSLECFQSAELPQLETDHNISILNMPTSPGGMEHQKEPENLFCMLNALESYHYLGSSLLIQNNLHCTVSYKEQIACNCSIKQWTGYGYRKAE